jgi:hypothetical protein
MIIVPSSAVDSMNLGGVMGMASMVDMAPQTQTIDAEGSAD